MANTKTQLYCISCGNMFWLWPCEVEKQAAKYCSRKCYIKERTVPLLYRFLDRIGKKTKSGCILWEGTHSEGRPVIGIGPRNAGLMFVSRLSYELV